MRILVTCAAWFLASYAIPKLLERGDEIVGLDNVPGFGTFAFARTVASKGKAPIGVAADITNPSLPDFFDGPFDCVIHMAAICSPKECNADPMRSFCTNVYGTYNVLRLASKHRARVVFASSGHVYGISPKYLPTDEGHPPHLQDAYTDGKVIGEGMCRLFFEDHGLPYISLRLYNAYGPGQVDGYFVQDTLRQAMRGIVHLRGKNVTKDFLYVSDIADAILAASTSNFVGAVNVGSGREATLGFVGEHIAHRLEVPIEWVKDPDIKDTRMACDRSRALHCHAVRRN